jgi:hypothetical protein
VNQTGEDIFIQMDYPYTNLRVPVSGMVSDPDDRDTKEEWEKTTFTIERGIYDEVKVWACGGIFNGSLNLERRLFLNFINCDEMIQDWNPRRYGEPSMEKPNLIAAPTKDIGWQFMYEWQSYTP